MKATLIQFSFIAGIALLLGVMRVQGFSEPTSSPPTQNFPATLNTGSLTQARLGFLGVNQAGAPIGLVVSGDPSKGKVGIGTLDPAQKLEVIGNIFLTGLLKPYGRPGQNDQILTRTSGQVRMDWTDRYAWLALTSNVNAPPTCASACPGGTFCSAGSCIPFGSGANACGNGAVDIGETCQNCPWDVGLCPAGPGCGDGALDPTTEECELPLGGFAGSPCQPVFNEVQCDDHTHIELVKPLCNACLCQRFVDPSLTCGPPPPGPPGPPPPPPPPPLPPPPPPPPPLPPPPPPGGPPGPPPGGSPCTVYIPGTQGNAPICGGSCPDTPSGNPQACKPEGTQGTFTGDCICKPILGPPQQQGEGESDVLKEYEEYLSRLSGIKVAEGASDCTGLTSPACPAPWAEYNEVCAEFADGSPILVRNCYQSK